MAKKSKKKSLVIEWPETPFTIQDIQNMHPDAKNITLRFRINKAIREDVIKYIGKNPTKVGRPTIVFAPCPVSSENLKLAQTQGVELDEQFEQQLVDVAKVDSSSSTTTAATPVSTNNTVKQPA